MVQILLAWQQALKCPCFWQLLHVASQAGFMIWTSATPVAFSAKRMGYLFSAIPGPHLCQKDGLPVFCHTRSTFVSEGFTSPLRMCCCSLTASHCHTIVTAFYNVTLGLSCKGCVSNPHLQFVVNRLVFQIAIVVVFYQTVQNGLLLGRHPF